jgi:hypothetical protein
MEIDHAIGGIFPIFGAAKKDWHRRLFGNDRGAEVQELKKG